MDKILLVVDQSINAGNQLEQAFRMARTHNAVLTGVFVQDLTLVDYYTVLGGEPVYYEHTFQIIKESLNESEKKTVQNIQYFVDQCKAAGVRFRVHFQKGDPVAELVEESRYADLMLMGYHAYNTLSMEGDQQLVKDMLSKARCPLVLLPEQGYNPDGVVLCYDGSESSLKAIEAYYHHFRPLCKSWPTYFLRVFEKESAKEELPEALLEILQLRFEKLHLIDLIGKPKDEIPYFAAQKGSLMVVMGAYGGSGIGRFFSGSTADHILRTGNLLAYITH
jgi:nucleotide-binding universal stress UspA family protein